VSPPTGSSRQAQEVDYVPAVEVTRGPLVESVHLAAIAVADSSGRIVSRLGGIDHVVYLRSCCKPFQSMAVVESGAAAKFGLTPKEIAVTAGSHSSEPAHVETVSGLLAKIGLGPEALQCGTHTPFSRAVAREYRRRGRPFTPLEHNCSGKHAGMLASAVSEGHAPSAYLERTHPVQQRILGIVSDLTGRMRDEIVLGVDGCSAPTMGVTLAEAARAFARLALPDRLDPRHRDSARTVVSAMKSEPLMVAGEGMLDTELTARGAHDLIAKRGAEGVQCLAFVREGTGYGVAAKVADGDNYRGRVALVAGILDQLGLMSGEEIASLKEMSRLTVASNRDARVGGVRPVFRLPKA